MPAQSVPAGVNPPVGASGTGGASTAVIVKTTSPAVAGTGTFLIKQSLIHH